MKIDNYLYLSDLLNDRIDVLRDHLQNADRQERKEYREDWETELAQAESALADLSHVDVSES